MIEWSSNEIQRWTSNLPVKGLKEVAEEILASIDGADLASFTEEDLQAAGMTSKVPPVLRNRIITTMRGSTQSP